MIDQGPVVRHRCSANVAVTLPRLPDRVAPGLLVPWVLVQIEISHLL